MRRVATEPSALFGAAAILVVLAFQLWLTRANPPGFHHDEAAFALNGWTLGHRLRDQDGALLPVVFPSYGDYKSAFFSYALAPVFLMFGPGVLAARATAVAFGLAALALVGYAAYRRGGPRVALATAALAGLTPWLFEVTRLAYDWSTFPFAAALVVAAVAGWEGASPRRSALVGLALAVVTYAYSAGRLLGPLLAVALLVWLGRVTRRQLAVAWATYAVLLVPLAAYRLRHPHGLTARYRDTTFVTPGMSKLSIAVRAARNWLTDVDPYHWMVGTDPKPYAAVPGTQALLVALVAAAAVGAAAALRTRDRFGLFALAGYLLSAVPAALTVDRHSLFRLDAMPVFAAALAAVGVAAILRWRLAPLAVTALAFAAVVQWAMFASTYAGRGRDARTEILEAGVPAVMARGLGNGGPAYVDYDDPYARTVGQWYAVTHGLSPAVVVRLSDGGVPPEGAMVIGRTQACDYTCVRLAAADSFWVARAEPSG